MSKFTIIIDSDDDDDVVEILECAPAIKLSTPVTNDSTEAVSSHSKKREPSTSNNKLPNIPNTKPAPKPSSKTTSSSNSKVLSSKKQAPPSPKSKALSKLASVQPTKATTSLPRPPASPCKAKAPPKPKAPVSPQRPTIPKIRHNSSPNPIPAPVVIYSTNTRIPSKNPLPLDSVNKLFQRDARTVTLSKAARRASAGLSRSSSSMDISKKIEMDKDLAAIFASSPEPSSSTSTPLSSTVPTSSQTRRLSPVIDKRPIISSSPPRQVNASSSQERRQGSLFSPNSLNSPAPTRKRPISSPQNPSPFSRPVFSKKKVVYGIDDEDGEEEDLELYINHVSSRRKLFSDELQEAERRKMGKKQCPVCYMMFPKQEIMEHSFECDGTATGNGLKKRTIGTAVALNAAERKRKNAGVQDTGPTNYYADSEGALALDGTGFGSEVTAGFNWESAGQTRFA
ncbi:hypothetical protein HMPREF1544_03697 [Mucor circinelloides 1006PhL]|uniref:Uncharacterized protein n=1 Tax=Mucor circinelloides f. circinelloides (strain 1006PhL) TaxID=1220926 RepID=S2JGQ1_MUCC1|nr:hypothetical protein HMPREF1544_03697 [Mucor circinelloides 1006PhL]KAG1108293.1 hypothetical protein G6F42_016040 [Rhizopus arrhizus]